MADLADMKYTKSELKEEKREISGTYEPPPYPWGLCIRLEKDELDKLGIKQLPGVGDEWQITCVATVTGVNQSASEQNEETSVALQITKLGVDGQKAAAKDKAEPAATSSAKGGSLMDTYKP